MADMNNIQLRFKEAIELINRGDAIQASEKLYKVVEDCIKLLAKINNIPKHKEAIEAGQWWTKLLSRASERLRRIYGDNIITAWQAAYELHIRGFHEEQMDIDEVKERASEIEDLLKLTINEVKTKSSII